MKRIKDILALMPQPRAIRAEEALEHLQGYLKAEGWADAALAYWLKFTCLSLEGIESQHAAKNEAYGNAILEPVFMFSDLAPRERILLALDSKASRLLKGRPYKQDNDLKDIAGYLYLLNILENGDDTI